MDNNRDTSLWHLVKALSAVVSPREMGEEPDESPKENRSANNLEERLQNWGSD